MKKTIQILFAVIMLNFTAFSQVSVVNNGGTIVISSGAYFILNNGSYINQTSGASDGAIDINGIMKLDGNFSNNATGGNVFINRNTDGEVVFNNTGAQTISGTGAYTNFEKLTIAGASETEIPAGKAVTVDGVLKIDGTLNVRSPLNTGATASLITNSTVNSGVGMANVERYISISRWHYFSTPIESVPNSIFDNPKNIYYWDDSKDEWWDGNDFKDNAGTIITTNIGWKLMPPSDFTPGKGYICFETWKNEKKIFTGTLNTGDIGFPLQYFNNAAGAFHTEDYDGWNLIGNPYPSAVDWESVSIVKTDIDNAIYYYADDGTSDFNNYSYYIDGGAVAPVGSVTTTSYAPIAVNQGSRYIPSMQSFFVKAKSTANGNIFTIPNAARVHSTTSYYKTGEEMNYTPNIMIRLTTEMNNNKDECVLRFIKEASSEYDGNFDALKRYSSSAKVPQVYFPINNKSSLAINTLSEIYNELIVPVNIKPGGSGICTIEASDINLDGNDEAYLIDKLENKRIDVSKDNYTFVSNGELSENRFYLVFKSDKDFSDIEQNPENPEILSIEGINEKDILIFSDNDKISIKAENSFSNKVELFNIIGEKVFETKFNTEYYEIPANFASGTYIVKVKSDSKLKTQKITI